MNWASVVNEVLKATQVEHYPCLVVEAAWNLGSLFNKRNPNPDVLKALEILKQHRIV